MEKIKTQEIYVQVDVKDRQPSKFKKVIVKTNYRQNYIASRDGTGKYDKYPFLYDDEKVTHWLEPQTDKYLLSKEEIIKLVGDAIDAGRKIEYNIHFSAVPTLIKSKQTYIDNLFK